MSRLAHGTFGAPGFAPEKRSLDATLQKEIQEAKRLQSQLACSWTEALRLAREDRHVLQLAELYQPYND